MRKTKPKPQPKRKSRPTAPLVEMNLRLKSLCDTVHQLYELRETQKEQMQKIVNCMHRIAQPRILPSALNEIIMSAQGLLKLCSHNDTIVAAGPVVARLRLAVAAVPKMEVSR